MQHNYSHYGNYHNYNRGFYGYGLGFGLGYGLGYPYGYSYPGYSGYYDYPSYDYYDEPYNYLRPAYDYPPPAVVPDMPPVENRAAHIQVIVPDGGAMFGLTAPRDEKPGDHPLFRYAPARS